MQNLDFKTPEGRKNNPLRNPLREIRSKVENLLEELENLRPTDQNRRKLLRLFLLTLGGLALGTGIKFVTTPEGQKTFEEIIKTFRGIYWPTQNATITPTPTTEPTPTITPTSSQIERMLDKEQIERYINERLKEFLIKTEEDLKKLGEYLDNFFKRNREIIRIYEQTIRGLGELPDDIRKQITEELRKITKNPGAKLAPFGLIGAIELGTRGSPLSFIYEDVRPRMPLLWGVYLSFYPLGPREERYYSGFLIKLPEDPSIRIIYGLNDEGLSRFFHLGQVSARGFERGTFGVNPHFPFVSCVGSREEIKIFELLLKEEPSPWYAVIFLGEKTREGPIILLNPPLEETNRFPENPWYNLFYSFLVYRIIFRAIWVDGLNDFTSKIKEGKIPLDVISHDLEVIERFISEGEELIKRHVLGGIIFPSEQIDDFFKEASEFLRQIREETWGFTMPSQDEMTQIVANSLALQAPEEIRDSVIRMIYDRFFDFSSELKEKIEKLKQAYPSSKVM